MGKTTIHVSCIDQRLAIISPPAIASGGKNEDMVEFEFCPLWAGFAKTAVFYRHKSDPYHAIVTDDKCIIPWEVLQTDGFVYFGVFGVKGDITRTSEVIRYRVTAGAITEGTKPSDPTPDIYEQLLGKMSNVESLVAPSDPYSLTGKLVQLDNFEGMPMNAVTRIEPVQAGSGDPSPSNIRPITGHTGAKLTRCGKNLVDYKSIMSANANVTYAYDGDKLRIQTTSESTYSGVNLRLDFALKAGVNYTLSAKVVAYASGRGRVGIRRKDTNSFIFGSLIFDGIGQKSISFTPDVDVQAYVSVFSTDATAAMGDITYSNIQLEIGSAATEYEPYISNVYTAAFGQTVYGGTFDWNTGVLTVYWVSTALSGSELHNYSGGVFQTYALSTGVPLGAYPEMLCSHYKAVRDYNSFVNNDQTTCMYGNGAVRIHDSQYTDFDDFKRYIAAQYAAGTPVQVAYRLANPTTIQLTPAQLTALQGMNNIFCDAGETTVSGRKDILWLTSGLLQRIQTLESIIATLEAAALTE
jgi:hypothetical protein